MRPPASRARTELDRRQLLRAGILGGLGVLGAPMLNLGRVRLEAQRGLVVSTRAADIVFGSTVVDMLGLLTLDWAKLSRWQSHPDEFTESDFRSLERSGVNIFHPAIETRSRDPRASALRWTAGWNRLLDSLGCFLGRVATINDLLHVPAQGKLGIVLGFQDSDHFAEVGDVETFFRLGQRVSQLTYNERNRIGSGCYERRDLGLTGFGARVVAEMNRVGMAIDLSHCGERTSLDAIGVSRHPVLITHANCRTLVPVQPRCKSDAVIRALAKQGGVMGITVVRAFVGGRLPSFARLLDHFDHVARVAGVEHVGIGSDVDVDALDPATGRTRSFYGLRGLELSSRVFQIADGLLARHWSPRAVELVLGGNFLRALAGIWPEQSWYVVEEQATRRDPFCPAPDPRGAAPSLTG